MRSVVRRAYFARTVRGVEALAWRDIEGRTGATLTRIGHRTVEFVTAAPQAAVVALRSVDDVFLDVGVIDGLTHTRDALPLIERQFARLPLDDAVAVCASLRPLPRPLSVSITGSFVGRRNYSRWEMAVAAAKGLAHTRPDWRCVDLREAPDEAPGLHVRIHIEAARALVGVRLASAPLYKRPYLATHLPGSLRPTLAYVMLQLAPPDQPGVLLDPFCGAGTIPLEAVASDPPRPAIGSDVSLAALHASVANAGRLPGSLAWFQADVGDLPLRDASVASIVTDLPWGHQTTLRGAPPGYDAVVEAFRRVLTARGRLVALAEDADELSSALRRRCFEILETYPVALSGRHPHLVVSRPAD